MGETKACRHIEGICPVLSDVWKINVTAGASSLATIDSILVGMLSGPVALFGFRFFSSFSTPSVVMVRLSMSGPGSEEIWGSGVLDMGVKAEQNWSLRMSLFACGEVKVRPE